MGVGTALSRAVRPAIVCKWYEETLRDTYDRKLMLDFLGAGEWKLSGFASVKGDLQALRAVDSSVPSASTLTLRIEPCGGFVARCVR